MELVFQEKITQYPNLIFCEEREQEETVDLIIPDRYPDGAEIIHAYGTPLVYSLDLGSDSITISGEVQAGVLYEGPEGQLRCVRGRVPFSFRREFQERGEDLQPVCSCRLQSIDARLLNSRKLLLRAAVGCSIQIYGRTEFRSFDVEEPAPALQLKRTELPLRLPLSLGEKRFSLQEELPLPGEHPEAAHLLKAVYDLQVTEQKAVGDKAVFKGELRIKALYESEEEALHSHSFTLPFSQYVSMDRDVEDCELHTELSLLSADTQPDGSDGSRLLTSVELCARCMATGVTKHGLIEDAFCTDGELSPEYVQQKITACLDRQEVRQTVELRWDQSVSSVLCAYAYPGKGLRRREGEKVLLEQGICCDVLYYDGDNRLRGCTLRGQMEHGMALKENARCRVEQIRCAEPSCTSGTEGITVRIPVELWIESTAEHELCAVSGGTVEALQETKKRPALLLRFTEDAEELWDIAKECKTSADAIREANALQEGQVPANTLLLIPM